MLTKTKEIVCIILTFSIGWNYEIKKIALDTDGHHGPPTISPIPVDQEILPPAGVERDKFVEQARTDITQINELMRTVSNLFNLEPIYIELMKEDGENLKKKEELFQEAYDALESMFDHKLFVSLSISIL